MDVRDEQVDEGADDEPASRHTGDEHEEERKPVFPDIFLRQFDGDGDDFDAEKHTRDLERDVEIVSPRLRVEPVERVRPHDETVDRRGGRLAEIEALLDEKRAKREERREHSNHRVRYVRLIRVQMVPDHSKWVLLRKRKRRKERKE